MNVKLKIGVARRSASHVQHSTPVIVEGEGAACRRGELIVGVGLPSNSAVELPNVLVLNRSTGGHVDRDCRGVID